MKYLLSVFFLLGSSLQLFGNDPFSKITVKSIKARCAPVEKSKTLLLKYADSVVVTLADSSRITADELNVFLEKSHSNKIDSENRSKMGQVCQKLSLAGKIYFCRGKHEIRADQAEIDVLSALCTLKGNVVIIQHGVSKESKPVEVTSPHATYNFKTEELVLVGSSSDPVSTTLLLGASKKS